MTQRTTNIQRLVIKIGSSVLTDRKGHLIPERLEAMAEQIIRCRDAEVPGSGASGRQILLVSSGAIACGMATLGLAKRPKALAQLQACAAIGQSELMHLYTQGFRHFETTVGQVLLTESDLSDRTRCRNAKQTLLALLHRRVVPIINENDTVAVEEMTFGDNDRLAALVACVIDAQLLILLSDVDGFMQDGKVLERIEGLNASHHAAVRGSGRQTTTGGMASKLAAARIVGHNGIPMVIANGNTPAVLPDIVAGRPVGTLFVPPANRLTPTQWWMAFALRQAHGTLTIDAGAAEALVEKGKSLLASGVTDVRGTFSQGACVALTDQHGNEIARGISNYSSSHLLQIRGKRSTEIARILGIATAREVVHRNHVVFSQEVQL